LYVTTGLVAICFLEIYYIKKNFLTHLLPANFFLLLISLLSLISGIPNDAWEVGHGLSFAGIFTHQNIMAMAILFTMPGIFSIIINTSDKQRLDKKNNWVFITLLTLNLFLITITYSRAAILVVFIGILITLIQSKAYKIIITLLLAIIVITTLTFTLKSVNEIVIPLLSKHGWDILATRSVLWQPSYEAALLGGIWGIGFGNSHPEIQIDNKSNYDEVRKVYIREKGNGILALIEETGIIGCILFFIPILYILKNISKIQRKESRQDLKYIANIILTFLIMFLIHSNFEAWFTAIGSTAMPMFLFLMYAAFVKLNRIMQ
jgi:O-antigen ligase